MKTKIGHWQDWYAAISCFISLRISLSCTCRFAFDEDYPQEMGSCFILERCSTSVPLYLLHPSASNVSSAGCRYVIHEVNFLIWVSLLLRCNSELIYLAIWQCLTFLAIGFSYECDRIMSTYSCTHRCMGDMKPFLYWRRQVLTVDQSDTHLNMAQLNLCEERSTVLISLLHKSDYTILYHSSAHTVALKPHILGIRITGISPFERYLVSTACNRIYHAEDVG